MDLGSHFRVRRVLVVCSWQEEARADAEVYQEKALLAVAAEQRAEAAEGALAAATARAETAERSIAAVSASMNKIVPERDTLRKMYAQSEAMIKRLETSNARELEVASAQPVY